MASTKEAEFQQVFIPSLLLLASNETLIKDAFQTTKIRFTGKDPQVIYSSINWSTPKGDQIEREMVKSKILKRLLQYYWDEAKVLPKGQDVLENNKRSRPKVTSDPLGRPILCYENQIGPSISFSHLPGITWAALALNNGWVGIDAADIAEFREGYPFLKVFHSNEFQFFSETFHSRGKAAAALWSAKEAVVKALGCGFHFIDPIDLQFSFSNASMDDHPMHMKLSEHVMERLPRITLRNVPFRTFQKATHFLSVALVDPQKRRK